MSSSDDGTLFKLAQAGDLEALTTYVSRVGVGCVNLTDNGRTPLWIAAGEGHLECVKYLVALGADLDKKCEGKTAVENAMRKGQPHVFYFLKAKKEYVMPLENRLAGPGGRRLAFVCGQQLYEHSLELVPHALDDARVIGRRLTAMGFHCHLHLNASTKELSDTFDSFLESLRVEDTVFFFFSGLGCRQGKKSLLFGTDRKFKLVRDAMQLAVEDVVENLLTRKGVGREKSIELKEDRNRRRAIAEKRGGTVIVVDACRSVCKTGYAHLFYGEDTFRTTNRSRSFSPRETHSLGTTGGFSSLAGSSSNFEKFWNRHGQSIVRRKEDERIRKTDWCMSAGGNFTQTIGTKKKLSCTEKHFYGTNCQFDAKACLPTKTGCWEGRRPKVTAGRKELDFFGTFSASRSVLMNCSSSMPDLLEGRKFQGSWFRESLDAIDKFEQKYGRGGQDCSVGADNVGGHGSAEENYFESMSPVAQEQLTKREEAEERWIEGGKTFASTFFNSTKASGFQVGGRRGRFDADRVSGLGSTAGGLMQDTNPESESRIYCRSIIEIDLVFNPGLHSQDLTRERNVCVLFSHTPSQICDAEFSYDETVNGLKANKPRETHDDRKQFEFSARNAMSRSLVCEIQGADWPGVVGWDSMRSVKGDVDEHVGAKPSLFGRLLDRSLAANYKVGEALRHCSRCVHEYSGRVQKPCLQERNILDLVM